MRELDVSSPGNFSDRCQHLQPNPRREGLPKTVTEWRATKERRKEERRQQRLLGKGNSQSESEDEDRTAFDITNSGQDDPALPQRRSARLKGKNVVKPSNFITNSRVPKRRDKSVNATQILQLDPAENSPPSTSGSLPVSGDKVVSGDINLAGAIPKGVKKGVAPAGFVVALQEPPIAGKKILNIKNVIQVMDIKCMEGKNPQKPRAAIICSNHLNMWPLPDLCTRDMAVGMLKDTDVGDAYFVSLYCDGEKGKKAVPAEFKRLNRLAKKEKIPMIMFMDSNSHSEALWSSKRTDKRGKEWEEFMSYSQNLQVLNLGDNFTYMSEQGQTIIDVTVATHDLADRVSQWSVVDAVANSDHLSIEMILRLSKGWTLPTQHWDVGSKSFNKEAFTALMEEKSKKVKHNRHWSPTDLDSSAQSIVDDLSSALDETAPLTSKPTNIARAGWFDIECKRLLRRLKHIRMYVRQWTRKRRRRGLPDYRNDQRYTWNDYKKCRQAFRKRCRRVKRKHWRRYLSGIGDTVVVARLSKKLDKNASAELGCFRHPSGVRCTPAETVQQLKDTHFPKSLDGPTDKVREFMSDGLADIEDKKADFINPTSVKVCISAFKSHKAPGPDGLQILPFKLLGPVALLRLTEMYKASYLLGAMPECFRLIKVIFIPKADKPAYDVPKAHRPISLMNNIMKIPERLFLWRQEDTNMVLNPLEDEQHGFMKCRSCDSAITVVTSLIEHSLNKEWFSVVAFLDFQGAYDALQNSSMENALKEIGTCPYIISWYKDFFYHRQSKIEIKGVEAMVYHTQGAPQGGIGSPFLWAAVLNELIKILKELDEVKVVAYADDLCLISSGPNKDECVRSLQLAVDAVMTWAGRHLLALSPTKSETILFTRKRKYPTIIDSTAKIKINGCPLNYERGSVRYLGIWLDRNLSWNDHVKIKTRKVKGLLHKLAGVSGDLWGFKPLMGKYCWEGLARPILSFGCIGWIPAVLRKKTVDTQLTQVQRLGYKLMAFFRRSTPNKGLDMMFNIMPMKYHLLKTAAGSYMRTVQVAPFNKGEMQSSVPAKKGHRAWIEDFIEDFGLDYLHEPLDSVPLHRKWDRSFQVDMSSMDLSKATAGKPRFLATLNAYTDGSKEKNRDSGLEKTGAGFVIMRGKKMLISNKKWAAFYYKLRDKNSVFQAEIFAIKKLCITMLNHANNMGERWITKDDSLDIYCDSRSAILALNSISVQSGLVSETIDLLNELAQETRSLTIRWIRSHQGHIGNERADRMARRGRDSLNPPSPESPKIAKAVMKSEFQTAADKLWKIMWNMEPTCRQTKDWFPYGPRPSFAFEILHLPKPICSQLIHFVTGHNFLKRHQAIIDAEELRRLEQHEGLGEDVEFHEAMDPVTACSLCGEDEETSYHIMTECPVLATTRVSVFGKDEILPPYDNIPVYKLISYLRDVKLKSLEMRPFVEEFKATELPERMPDWARVNDNDSSSDDELQADTRYAKECGDKLLHYILYQKYSAKKISPLGLDKLVCGRT